MERELTALWLGLLGYLGAGVTAMVGQGVKRQWERPFVVLLSSGLLAHGLAIGWRWERLGHGPFVTMFEILSSNIWSLLLVFAWWYGRLRVIRPVAAVVMPVMMVMMGWLTVCSTQDSYLPPTYETIWLYIHVGFGKIYLGALLTAMGLGGVVLWRWRGGGGYDTLPDDTILDGLISRLMVTGLVFGTLMLVAGAIWAQDAWGRFWGWDTLERWTLINWLLLAMALHLRPLIADAVRVRTGAVLAVLVFWVGFLTFFGVPFVSTSPHQGMV